MLRRTFNSLIVGVLATLPGIGMLFPRRIKWARLVFHSDTIDIKKRMEQFLTFNANPILGMPPGTMLFNNWQFYVCYKGNRRYYESHAYYEGGTMPTFAGVPLYRTVEHTFPGKLVDKEIEYEV